MQTSKKRVNRNLIKQINALLYQTITDLRQPKKAEEFLKDFLTKTEQEALAKRLGVAYYLNQGRSYENIKTNLAVSSTTIAWVAEQMKKKGFQVTLKKIKAEEWADKWTKKLTKMMKIRRK